MSLITKLSLVSSAVALVASPLGQVPLGGSSSPLPSVSDSVSSHLACGLPPAIDPSGDGLSSADDLFSSDEALAKQVERHQAIVRVPSISYDDLGEPQEDPRWAPFFDLHQVLQKTYPIIHEKAELEKINTLGLVYTIHGANQQLAPTLMLAHQDVVPVGDPAAWRYPPFDAYYDGEWLWGRGASDDKNSLTGILSAVEALLDQGWEPTRTLILAFGFDEECSGVKGARKLAEHLTDRYGDGSMAVILDEGGEGLTSLDDDVVYALPAVMEKGHVDIWLELHVRGGHSSIPFAHTGIGIVAEIIEALEANPFPAALLEKNPLYNRLICLAQYSPDAWPGLGDLLKDGDLRAVTDAIVSAGGGLQYLIQTSQAVDVIEGGQKINAMPEIITLGTNYRVAPQDSIHSVQKNYLNVIADIVHKYNLNVVAFEGDDGFDAYLAEAGSERLVQQSGNADYNGTLILSTSQVSQVTPTSPMSGSVWNAFAGAVQHTWAAEGRTVVPAGSIMNGNTDTRHYLNLSPHIYRWTPHTSQGSQSIHTTDERVKMAENVNMTKFYYNFIRIFDQASLD